MADEILMEIQRSLGRIEQKIDSNATTLATHTAHDETVSKALFERIEALQLGAARQKGFMAALSLVGTALGTGVGYLFEHYRGHS